MVKRDWKAITLDWIGLENFDDTDECAVCLTQREVAILKALLETAYWPTRWDDLGESTGVLEARMALLDGKLNYCSDVGGESIIFFTQINLNVIAINVLKYDGTTVSINIYAPVTIWNDGGTDDREAALCMAAMSLVGTICAGELQALTERYIGSALIFAALFILTGGAVAFGVLVVGSLIAGVGYTAAKAALEDRDAQLQVACCMYEGLRGKAVTSAVLSDSLDACGFIAGSNAAIVRDFVDRSIQSEDTYFAMLDIAGKMFVQASVTGINLCECGDCGICTFDNPGSDLPHTYEYGLVGVDGNPGACAHAEEWTAPPYSNGRRLEVTFEMPVEQTVSRVSWDCYHVNDSFPAGQLARLVYLLDDEKSVLDTWGSTIGSVKDEWYTDYLTGTPVAEVKFIRLYLRFVCDCPLTREIRADNVRVFCS